MAARKMVLWGFFFGLMMAFPHISGAQDNYMVVNFTSAISTENGRASVKTNYESQTGDSIETGVQKNQYLNDVLGIGSPSTVIAEFVTNGNAEIAFAGLIILKDPAKGNATILIALEKIGTGASTPNGAFQGAGGSEIRVTETEHSTTGSTQGGGVSYLVESSGVGTLKAGMVGEYCTECAKPPPEVVAKGGMGALQMNLQDIAQSVKPGSQSAKMNVEFSGKYKGFFEGIVAPPK